MSGRVQDNGRRPEPAVEDLVGGLYELAAAVDRNLTSSCEISSGGERPNLTDGLYFIGRQLHHINRTLMAMADLEEVEEPEGSFRFRLERKHRIHEETNGHGGVPLEELGITRKGPS